MSEETRDPAPPDPGGAGAPAERPASREPSDDPNRQHRSHARKTFLAEASRCLADSLDYESTLETVAGLALPLLGSWSVVDLVSPDGSVRRLSIVHPDPELQVIAVDLKKGWPPLRDDPVGVPVVARTRRPEIVNEITDDFLVSVGRNEKNLSRLRALGMSSFITVPMSARGRVLGAITFIGSLPGRRFDETDVSLAEDLASRCGIAIDNARLYRAALTLADTERAHAQEAVQALGESEERFRFVAEMIPQLVWSTTAEGYHDYYNQRWYDYTGMPREGSQGWNWKNFLHPDDLERSLVAWQRALETGGPYEIEYRLKRASDAEYRWFIVRALPLRGADGRIVRWFGTCTDVHDERNAREALRQSEERFRAIFEGSNDAIFIYELEEDNTPSSFSEVNQTACERLGYSREELLQRSPLDLAPAPHGAAGQIAAAIRQLQDKNYFLGEFEHLTSGGARTPVEINARLIELAGKSTVVSIARDISERKAAESQLLQRDRVLDAISQNAERLLRSSDWEENAPDMLQALGSATEASRVYLFQNLRDEQGRNRLSPRFEWVAERMDSQIEHPELRNFTFPEIGLDAWERTWSRGDPVYARTEAMAESEREPFEVQGIRSLLALPIHVAGQWWGVLGFYECKTGREWSFALREALRVAASTLSAAIQRQQSDIALVESERQLRLSQRMESVGRLAGGIAHDFNNLLMVIRGTTDMALMDVPEGNSLREELQEVQKAADRAATLTQQLLAFSRKQVLQPQVINLNEIVSRTETMLRRLIGEDIEFVTMLDPQLAQVVGDPGQLDQILMNLVVNARDAMPTGGTLVIKTSDAVITPTQAETHSYQVTPGRYVVLTVEDTGCGMDADTLAHVYEPFYTTKDQGKGTGLGLAMVYGIVKQSGGYIWAESIPDGGTTFRIYLPRVEAKAVHPEEEPDAIASGRGETLLVVEDDAAVGRLIERVLQRGGYDVIRAGSGEEALRMAEKHTGRIDLVLTDVVMPQMSGAGLAARLREIFPETKVVFMSGYTDEAIVRHGVRDSEVHFLQKPISPKALLNTVADLLHGPGSGSVAKPADLPT